MMPSNSTEDDSTPGLDDNIPDNPDAGMPADNDDGTEGSTKQPLNLTADQASLLGIENGNPGDTYTIQITIGDAQDGNFTADLVPASAKLEDNTQQPSDQEDAMDKMAPMVRKPKQRTLSPAQAGFAANGDDL